MLNKDLQRAGGLAKTDVDEGRIAKSTVVGGAAFIVAVLASLIALGSYSPLLAVLVAGLVVATIRLAIALKPGRCYNFPHVGVYKAGRIGPMPSATNYMVMAFSLRAGLLKTSCAMTRGAWSWPAQNPPKLRSGLEVCIGVRSARRRDWAASGSFYVRISG